jgi:hypothetical protein
MPDILPAPVLAKVLQLVPQEQRLQHCASVCTHWKAAGVSIEILRLKNNKLPALQSWITQHAQQLVSIHATHRSSSTEELQLPCADLQQLTSINLSGQFLLLPDNPASPSTPASAPTQAAAVTPAPTGELLLRASSSSSASAQQLLLPKLRELKVSFCSVASTHLFLQLSRLTSLTKLGLSHVSICDYRQQYIRVRDVEELCEALCALLLVCLNCKPSTWIWSLDCPNSLKRPAHICAGNGVCCEPTVWHGISTHIGLRPLTPALSSSCRSLLFHSQLSYNTWFCCFISTYLSNLCSVVQQFSTLQRETC